MPRVLVTRQIAAEGDRDAPRTGGGEGLGGGPRHPARAAPAGEVAGVDGLLSLLTEKIDNDCSTRRVPA